MSKVEIKICGLTRIEDARAALDLGADYLGFVVYAGSPRGIDVHKLVKMMDGLPSTGKAIAVFVNESRSRVEQIAIDCGLFAVQLHGDEQPDEFAGLSVPIWRSVAFGKDVPAFFPEEWGVDRYVIDSSLPGAYGGTGRPADWRKAAEFAGRYPAMLAGGLTVDTVAVAIRTVRPLGVDVASSVEKRPGVKDHDKMASFIFNARRASDEINSETETNEEQA